jgi:hypothetical protein
MTQEEIKLQPHKMVNGIAVLLTESEIAEFNQPPSKEDLLNQLNSQKQTKTAQCQTYLEGTDWQAAAFIKYGRPVDANVSENCLKAKQWKIDIAACTTLEELNAININFQ